MKNNTPPVIAKPEDSSNVLKVDFTKAYDKKQLNSEETDALKSTVKILKASLNHYNKLLQILCQDNISHVELVENLKEFFHTPTLNHINQDFNKIPNNQIIDIDIKHITVHDNAAEVVKDIIQQQKNYLRTLNGILSNREDNKNYPVPTYNGLYKTIMTPQSKLFKDCLAKAQEEGRITLQRLLVEVIAQDNSLEKDTKAEALDHLEAGQYETVLERWLIKPLSKEEKRILRALRTIVHRKIQQKDITGIGKDVYEAEISFSEFFEECGLKKRTKIADSIKLYHNSYDYNQTKPIKDILFQKADTKGLHKEIFLEHNSLLITRFILQIKEIEEEGKGFNKEATRFRISMPSFLFVPTDNSRNYYNQDQAGWKRFISTGKMAQSDTASNLAHYIEYTIQTITAKAPKKTVVINLETLVTQGGEECCKHYKESKTKTQKSIEKVLDNMKLANFVISDWQEQIGKNKQLQYIFKSNRISLHDNNDNFIN